MKSHARRHEFLKPTQPKGRARILQKRCSCGQHSPVGGECGACRSSREKAGRRDEAGVEHDDAFRPVHDALSTPGRVIEPEVRAPLESRFGQDFSRVRIHTGRRAADSARSVDALAYTVGRDVVFGEGQYDPGHPRGLSLLAHELTHVAQQASGGVASESTGEIREPDPATASRSERQAEDAAALVLAGRGAMQRPTPVGPGTMQRAEKLGTPVTQLKGAKAAFKVATATFDGKDFVLLGDGKELLRAGGQSGRPLAVRAKDAKACGGSTSDCYMNDSRYVGIEDNGPIPEGQYEFKRSEMVTFTDEEERKMRLAGEGAYVDPSGGGLHGDWGAGRVHLRPAGKGVVAAKYCGNTKTRSGFYLHGGVMPGSSGCIDIGDSAIKQVVDLLKGYTGAVRVTVKYTQPAPGCGFLSKAAGRFMYPPGKNPSITDRIWSVLGGGDD